MSCDNILKEKGKKLTLQRRMILDIISKSDGHLTAENIINYVQARAPGVNKSTIYRTLELLEGLGCVVKSELNDKLIYHHAKEGQHHHLICQVCGKNIDYDEDLFIPVERALKERHGFLVNFKHVVIRGLCRDCRDLV